MNQFLPMFPLNIVSFPNEIVNLHIFEERYKQLINECWEQKTTFGMPPFIEKKLMDYGTEMEVKEISRVFKNGEMNIKAVGKRAFRVIEFHKTIPEKLYSAADIEFLDNNFEVDFLVQEELTNKLMVLFERLGIKKNLSSYNSFGVAHYIGMTPREEYDLLKIEFEKDRQQEIINHLDKIMPVIDRAQSIRERIQMNGHFRNYPKLDF